MNHSIFKVFIATLLFFFLIPTQAFADVVINEIYPKPTDEQSEWIELYNTAAESVSLNLWKLENVTGEKKSFIINASAIIQGHGFLIFPKSQTSISLTNEGDTVRLIDAQGAIMDSQGYNGTLGFNTSVGRSPDGGIGMTICTSATMEAKNDCPIPTPTPSSAPSPTNSPVLTPTEIPVEPVFQNTNNPSDETIPRITRAPEKMDTTVTPTQTIPPDMVKIEIPKSILVSKVLMIQITIVIGAWGLLAGIAYTRNKRKKKKTTQQT